MSAPFHANHQWRFHMLNPWFAIPFQAARFGFEAQNAAALQLMRLTGGTSKTEVRGTVADKIAAPPVVPADAAPSDVPADVAPSDVPADAAPPDVPADAAPPDVPADAAPPVVRAPATKLASNGGRRRESVNKVHKKRSRAKISASAPSKRHSLKKSAPRRA